MFDLDPLLTFDLVVSDVTPRCRYEDGQVGDANINTQDTHIQREIMSVIGTHPSSRHSEGL